MKTVYCQEDKKLKDNFCQASGGGQAVNMKIGEVRVAEDSDFALLKVSINFKTIGKTIIFLIIYLLF